jgi:hypothetical protein
MKGIRADIYRARTNNDGSNGGLSSRVDQVTIIDGRIDGPFEPSDDAPAVRLVERMLNGAPYYHLEPFDRPEGKLGPMMGGTYVATPDSRLRRIAPSGVLPLHDRFETQAEYDSYSN